MLKKLFALPLLLLLSVFCLAETLTVYHTSDTHGFYFPRLIDGKNIGGFAALAKLVSLETNPYLLLDSGDYTSGTAEAKETKGALSVDFFNKLHYNALTIGNHEGDFGEDNMLVNLQNFKPDVLALNVFDKKLKTYPQNVKPYAIYNISGKKIVVIGVAKDPNPNFTRIKTSGDRKKLKKIMHEVVKFNPDAVIMIIHNSVSDDKHEVSTRPDQLIKGIGGINLVLGGHAHKIVQNKVIDGVTYVESGAELRGVSKIDLEFNEKTNKLESIHSQYITLDVDKIGQDKDIEAFAEEHRNKDLDTVIAQANETLYKDSQDEKKGIDSPLGNIFADLVKQQTGADIGMQNSGGVRVDIAKGPITKRLVFEVFPFPNKTMVVKVNGNFIKKMVLVSLREDRSLFQYSGMNVVYTYKHNRPELVSLTVNGKPIENEKLYTIAVNDYIAQGNSEGFMFKKVTDKKLFSDKGISQIFIDYLSAHPEGINAQTTGRIKKAE